MTGLSRQLSYTPLERLAIARPVDRIAHVAAHCIGKDVLDLGAMDETAVAAKRGRGTWMHEEIAKVAKSVIGLDSSPLIPPDGLQTARNARIVHGDIDRLGEWLIDLDFSPDIVVAGELIEHLANPLRFLASLTGVERLRGRTLLLTTPNATAIHNVAIGMLARESTHEDHLCILSYKTLFTLCRRAGFSDWEIRPYRAAFTEMRARHPGFAGTMVAVGEKAVNAVEWLFPLLSFGYVVRVTI